MWSSWLRSRTRQLTRRHVEESSSFFWPLTSSIGVAIPFSGQGDLILGLWDYVLGTRRRSSSFPLNDQICHLHPPSLFSTSPLQPKFLSSIFDQLPSLENHDVDRGIVTIHRRLQNRIAFREGVRNMKESLPSLLLLHRSKSWNLHRFNADPIELLFLETWSIWVSRTLLFAHLGHHSGNPFSLTTFEVRKRGSQGFYNCYGRNGERKIINELTFLMPSCKRGTCLFLSSCCGELQFLVWVALIWV